jgi:hypothetical protein
MPSPVTCRAIFLLNILVCYWFWLCYLGNWAVLHIFTCMTGCVSAWKTIVCDCCVVCSCIFRISWLAILFYIRFVGFWLAYDVRAHTMRLFFMPWSCNFRFGMTKQATQPDHSLLARSFQPEWTRLQVIQACRLLLYSKLTILFGNWWQNHFLLSRQNHLLLMHKYSKYMVLWEENSQWE